MSLKLVWDNREGSRACTCDVCGHTGKWSNRWEGLVFGIGVGYRGEDRYYFTCSNECRKKEKEEKMFLKHRIKLHNEWWAAYGDLVDDFEKDFKKIMDIEYAKLLNQ